MITIIRWVEKNRFFVDPSTLSKDTPKFKIGNSVKHQFFLEGEKITQMGRITAVLVYESKVGDSTSITANYTYTVSFASHHPWALGTEESADEHELTLLA